MHVAMSMMILADADAVYRTASRVEEWATERFDDDGPLVTVMRGHAVGRVFRVRPRCHFRCIPMDLTIVQQCDPTRREIHHRHVFGLTKGMTSVWRVQPENGAVRLSIECTLTFAHPFAALPVGRAFVEYLLVRPLLCCILARLRTMLESAPAPMPELQHAEVSSPM